MGKSRIFYLIGGVLFLLVAITGLVWWEFSLGEPSKPVLYIGLSPFGLEAKLLGSQIFKISPLLEALFLIGRALAILGSSTIIAGALLGHKPWSRRLLNPRPFTASVGFAVFIILALVLLSQFLNRFLGAIPFLTQVAPNLADVLIPYSGKRLNINLHPVTNVDFSASLDTRSEFTPTFYIALLSGVLCIIGRYLLRKETRVPTATIKPETELPPPPPPTS